MSLESIVRRITQAFQKLDRGAQTAPAQADTSRDLVVGRNRSGGARSAGVGEVAAKAGFDDEAMPWMGAVYRYALRLTRGDGSAADDLVQETFLRAYRAWASFTLGTNCRAWLFRICRNVHLHHVDRASARFESSESEMGDAAAAAATAAAFKLAGTVVGGAPDALFFDRILDDRVVNAIDTLPQEYRDALVLSDLGDLSYPEIATVLEIPVGTVKSRIFRGRQLLQTALVDYATDMGYIERGTG